MDKRVIRNFDELARTYADAFDNIFFIQVGANDGKIGDPLFDLINEFGWRGVLVEPQKHVYEKSLLTNYQGHDNLCFENVAIGEEDGQRELFKLSFSQERWATGLASFHRSHLERHIAEGYIERMIGTERDRLPANQSEYITSEIVTTVTFDTLLDKYQIKRLDLLQIDTEGYDYTLLQLFDFNRLRPAIIQFETHVMTDEQQNYSRDLLDHYGYLTFVDYINTVACQRKLAEELEISFDVEDLRGGVN